MMRVFLALALLVLAACAPAPAPVASGGAAEAEVQAAREAVAEALVPTLVAAREIVQEALPEIEPPPPTVSPRAVALIVRWEISSPAYYVQRLQRPIWPGAASGVTWGVGYDGGHQTSARIRADWTMHPSADELATTSGIVGTRAREVLPRYRHILTPLGWAQEVFAGSTLPAYDALAARTFRDGWDGLPPDARGVLTSLVFNRGASMRGDARREMRALRDECVPRGDLPCMAAQIRSMKRLWPNLRGLQLRREDEARLVETAT
jgi:hypothetical protein